MVTKKEKKAEKKIKNLRPKSLTAKQTKNVKGGGVIMEERRQR